MILLLPIEQHKSWLYLKKTKIILKKTEKSQLRVSSKSQIAVIFDFQIFTEILQDSEVNIPVNA